jgi:hypothetical protein
MIAVRPHTIAEIFDRAVTLIVRRWSTAAAVALIASIPSALSAALQAADPRIAGHASFAPALLQFAFGVGLIYAIVALTLLFAGSEDRPSAFALYGAALGSFWRYLRVSIMTGFLLGITAALGALLIFVASTAAGVAGTVVAAAVAAIVAVPVFFVLQLALADAALEGTGATTSVGDAFRRALSGDQRVRTAKLAFAAVLCYFAPQFVIEAASALLVDLTKQRWIAVLAPPLEMITGLVFFAAVVTVAAIDYRVRKEGADLDAVLDATEPA